MTSKILHLPVFVYGTLKRGEVRENRWPHSPIKILPATIEAALYDLGPYPALREGRDVVGGELWFIAQKQMQRTLDVLDVVEGYGQDAADLYIRRIVRCTDENGQSHRAYTYFYADQEALQNDSFRVSPNENGICFWGTTAQS